MDRARVAEEAHNRQCQAPGKWGHHMPNRNAGPVVDLGNYPVIFASAVARIERLSNNMVSFVMVEERLNDAGSLERVVVLRLIRPGAAVICSHCNKPMSEQDLERVRRFSIDTEPEPGERHQ